MPLEAAAFVQDLVVANPPGTDAILQGDDHIRLIKTALDNTFPNGTRAQYFARGLAKAVDYTILAADMEAFLHVDASGAARTQTLPALAAGNDGWFIRIQKVDSSANAVIIGGTINGVVNLSLTTQWSSAYVWWDGTAWRAFTFTPATNLLTALTAPAVDDVLPIFDLSVLTDKKITLENMLKVVNVLTADAAPALADVLLVYSAADSAVRKMIPGDFLRIISLLTEDTTPDFNLDFVVTNDATDNSSKKVKLSTLGGFAGQLLHVRDEKASGTEGGTFTSGAWRTRTLNTSKTNEITGASLAANQITLPAGTYYIDAGAPACAVNEHAARLQNITDTATTLIGTSGQSTDESQNNICSYVRGRFTIAGAKVFELQHQCQTSRSTDGLGGAHGFQTEVYAEVMIWKVR